MQNETEKDPLDKFVEELEMELEKQDKEDFSPIFLEEFRNTSNIGTIENPDGFGETTYSDDEYIKMYLKVQNNVIVDVSFESNGCGMTHAVCGVLTRLIQNMKISDAKNITKEELLKSIGNFPESHMHSVYLALKTLKKAIESIK